MANGLLGLGGISSAFGAKPPAGLLGQYFDPAEMRRQQLKQGLLNAGIGLLTGGKGSTGEVIGQGLAAGLQGANNAGINYKQDAMGYNQLDMQMKEQQRAEKERAEKEKQKAAIMQMISEDTPENQQIALGNPQAWWEMKVKQKFEGAGDDTRTTEIKNWEYAQKNPDFSGSLKSPAAETIYGTGLLGSDNKWYYPKKTGEGFVSPDLPPGVTLQDPGAKAAMVEEGKGRGKARVELPAAIIGAQSTITKIDALLNNPDLPNAIGYKSWVPDAFVGNGVIDVRGRVKELLGGAFLEAYNTLKGGGQITQIEGDKAQAAYQRMEQAIRASDPVVFKEALIDFKTQIDIGTQKLAARAGQPYEGLDPDVPPGISPELWNEMTPEQKALWN